MRETIGFLLNGERIEVGGFDPTMTVLQWLRERRRLKGTKEGCAAGDCGACTVLAGHLEGGRIDYQAINACITLLPMLDGLSVITVEGVAGPAGVLHPCQQAMVDCHGSQCGFCTPGFVMSLYGAYLGRASGRDDADGVHVDDLLAGNLCRCTGYAPIRRAAAQMITMPAPAWDDGRYGASLVAALTSLQHDEEIEVRGAGAVMRVVASEDQLAAYCADHPDARIVGGATDVGLWVTKQHRALGRLVHLKRASGPVDRSAPREVDMEGGRRLWLSAFTSLGTFATGDRLGLAELLRRFAGPQVRALGTVGGNIANASPIGDLAPAFLALGARIHLRRGAARRALPLERFFVAYGKTALESGEIVCGFSFDCPAPSRRFAVYKVSKRFDDDISAVSGAFALRVENGVIAEARIAYGGMAAIPKRALAVEAALTGRSWSRASIDAALAAYAADFSPISDMRASAAYRLRVAENLLVRFYLEHGDAATNTRLVGAGAQVGG